MLLFMGTWSVSSLGQKYTMQVEHSSCSLTEQDKHTAARRCGGEWRERDASARMGFQPLEPLRSSQDGHPQTLQERADCRPELRAN